MEALFFMAYPEGLLLQTLKKSSSPSGSPHACSMSIFLWDNTWTSAVGYSSIGDGGSFFISYTIGLGSRIVTGSVHTMVCCFPVTVSLRLIVLWKDSMMWPLMIPLEPCRANPGFLTVFTGSMKGRWRLQIHIICFWPVQIWTKKNSNCHAIPSNGKPIC